MFKMKKIVFFSLLCISLSAGAAERYVPQGAGSEILDTQTQLIWQRCAVGMVWSSGICMGSATMLSHQVSLATAKTLAASSGKGWRVPSIRELNSIVNYTASNPAIDGTAFPTTPSLYFWASSPYQYNTAFVWCVDFNYGTATAAHTDVFALRLVRLP
jgi:hypothetical protein